MQNFGMYTSRNPLLPQQGYAQGYNQGLYNSAPLNYTQPSLFMQPTTYMPMQPTYMPMQPGFDTFGMGMMPMFGGGCCHGHCGCDDGSLDGFEKGLLIGAGAAVGVGLIVKFAKPIGNFFGTVGKGLWSGIKWTGSMIGKGASAAWKGIKWAGGKIAQGAKWLWDNTLGKLFKKKDKTTTEKS